MRRLALVVVCAAACAGPLGARGGGAAHSPVERAWRLYFDGQSAAARAALDRLLAARPDDPRALFGAAHLALDDGDEPRAFALWARLCASPRLHDDPLGAALAEIAAAGLVQLVELPDPAGAEKRLAELDPAALPAAARRRLLDARARLARLRGDEDEARRLDAQGGAFARWFVAGPYGTLPRLDLAHAHAPESGGDAGRYREARARAGAVVLEAPRSRAGVLYAVQWAQAARDQRVVAAVETEQPWRLIVDGHELAASIDEDHYPARQQHLSFALAAGWHRVALAVAAPSGRADVNLALVADPPLVAWDGPALRAPVSLGRTPAAAERWAAPVDNTQLGDLVAAELAALHGASDDAEARAERLIERAPKLAAAQLLAGHVALDDPSRPATLARDRARRRFERALALDPRLVRARYLLALMELQVDRPREALARLRDAPGGPSWRLAQARYEALRARGWQREAEEALAEARRLNPAACGPLEAELSLKREHHDVAAALPLARQAAHCGGGSDELADVLRDRGDLEGAIAEYQRLLALDPERESFQAGLADTLQQAGHVRESAALREQLVARHPRRTHDRRQLADAYVALGDAARAHRVLEEGLAETPESNELHRALEALCEPSRGPCNLLDPFRVDGRAVIAAYERDRERPRYQSPAVIVLDRTITRVFPTGARLTLTHNIIQVLAKDGIDKWGEVQIPEGADVLTLRTIKKDGTTREPEQIIEKQTVSVPDLAVGDYVEFEYVDPSAPPAAFLDGFLAERFFFRSFDAPLDRTEYVLVTPAGVALQIDARGDAPTMKVEERGALAVRTWSGRYKPQGFQEPAATPFSEHLPSVRVASGLSYLGWRDFLRDSQFGTLRANRALTERAVRETAALATPAAKLAALDAWVRRHITHGGGLDEPATSILAREQGNRVVLLAALLRAAGVPAEIALVHATTSAELDGKLPDLEGYDQAVLLAGDLVVDPRFRHGPAGFVAPNLRGGSMLRLGAGPLRLERERGANPDDRKMELDVRLALDGSAEVTAREQLRGWPALQWREALEKLTPDRVRPEFEQHTLGYYFPGSTLRELKWAGADDDAGVFSVEYRFFAPALARRVGRELVLPAPYPAALGKRYVGVAERKTPLSIDYAAPTVLTETVTLPAGVEVALPPPARLAGFGRFEQVAHSTAGHLVLDARFELPQMRVEPGRYRDFVEYAARVDRYEARAAELRVPQ